MYAWEEIKNVDVIKDFSNAKIQNEMQPKQ
jgi:hypothetical protein